MIIPPDAIDPEPELPIAPKPDLPTEVLLETLPDDGPGDLEIERGFDDAIDGGFDDGDMGADDF